MTATTTGMFTLKSANVRPPKASLEIMDIIEIVNGMCG